MTFGTSPGEATKSIMVLEHLGCGDKPGELGLFNVERKRLQGDLGAPSVPECGTRELERDLGQGPGVTA